MKHFFAWACAAVLGLSTAATAQVMPAAPPTTLQGQTLKTWLVQNWYDGKRVDLGYDRARGKMYNYVDVYNGQLTCVYSGYSVPKTLDSTATSTSNVGRLNCEHSIPQSWFNEVSRMKADIHHLYPTYDTWNSNRGSDPFGEIADASTQLWMRGTVAQAAIPAANIDEWSEDTNTMFEPREDHKGNLARAAFYFYTMHQGQSFDPGKEVIAALADLNTLYQWHLGDPVDARERERNRRAAKSQGNFNPYIAYPDLVARAWGFTIQPTFSFATATGTTTEGNTGTKPYTVTVSVTPAPTAALTVQVAPDAANSTALTPSDYLFSAQTLTFAAGQTTQTVTITVNGDTTPEADETVQLNLLNASSGAAIGGPASHVLTITNDDGPAPTIAFASATGTITEGDAGTTTYTANVTLTGSAPSAAVTIPVTVVTSATTADATDYVLNTTSVTFAAGQATQTVPVTITVSGDVTPESNETVRLQLGTPTTGGAVLSLNSTHTLSILNDDQAPAGTSCSDLYFSEYAESSTGNTKYVEIFNPTPDIINLAGLRVDLFANGATTPTSTQALTGMLNPGAVYVIANAGSVAPVLAKANVTSNITFFNGDDALGLFDGTDTIDVIGVIGQQPTGTGWVIPGGGSTTNNTLVRKATVGHGNTRWAQAAGEWQSLGVDVFTNVGLYTSSACLVTGTPKAAPLGTGLAVYPNPTAGAFQVRVPGLRGRHTAEIGLYNALGQQVLMLTQPLSGADAATLNVAALPAGLYSVRVTVDGVRYTSRVAVRP
ncbi:endonuclease [Hymenobacter algoricola]|uniref:LTD domain-containing protein n=1 Tax=Hymenobacter algoricola TaxID=486267 RepID=A0ABP7NTG0_9BACT